MRHLVVCALARGLFWAGAADARETPHSQLMIERFQALCGVTNGDGRRAVELVRAQDWAPIPSQVFEQEGSPFKDVSAYMTAEEGNLISMLLVGTMTEVYEGVSVTMPVCATMLGDMSEGAVATDLPSAVQTWLGMTPLAAFSDDGMEAYGFTLENGARRPASSEAAATQALLNGRLQIIATKREEQFAMILYMRAQLR
jgi:hypothetical protein